MVKRFRIHETRDFEFRVDAINVLNTPNFAARTSPSTPQATPLAASPARRAREDSWSTRASTSKKNPGLTGIFCADYAD
jgi:hypothetical protein